MQQLFSKTNDKDTLLARIGISQKGTSMNQKINYLCISLYTGLISTALLVSLPSLAAEIPHKSAHDTRVRYVQYKNDDVAIINVRRGVVTRVVLETDEKITHSGTGFAARCDKEELEWCIRAENGSNQIWIKPKRGASHNNLELATNKRDYSMRFNVLPDSPQGMSKGDEMYRIIFQYPKIESAAYKAALIDDHLASRPLMRNTQYSMEVLADGNLIAPSFAFDDGRFTYFRLPNNREIPAPFAFGADGEEVRVNFHMDRDIMVIHRLAPRFVLRLGDAVVGIWNEAFDPDGIAPHTGTVTPRVQREIQGSNVTTQYRE